MIGTGVYIRRENCHDQSSWVWFPYEFRVCRRSVYFFQRDHSSSFLSFFLQCNKMTRWSFIWLWKSLSRLLSLFSLLNITSSVMCFWIFHKFLKTHDSLKPTRLQVRSPTKGKKYSWRDFVSTTLTRLTSKVTVNTTNITTDDEFTARRRQLSLEEALNHVHAKKRCTQTSRTFPRVDLNETNEPTFVYLSRRDRFHARVPVGCICTRYQRPSYRFQT